MNIKHLNVLVIRGLCLLAMSFLQASHATAAHPRPDQTSPLPNIIIIMTDDMGFSDIGCYGSELLISQCCWGVGFFGLMSLSVSQRNREEQ